MTGRLASAAAAAALASLALLAPAASEACTLAFWNASPEFPAAGRTMDLYFDDQPGLLINPKGMRRNGGEVQNPHSWTSRFGSAGVTALGCSDATASGVNEAGLSANLIYMEDAKFEAPDARPCVSSVLLAQYLLDTAGSVKEAIAELEKVRVSPAKIDGRDWPCHLALCDASGDSAIVEFVDGEMQVRRGRQFNVLSNGPKLDEQLANLKRYKPFGGALPLPGDIDSASRFVRASTFLASLEPASSEADATLKMRSLLSTVSAPAGAKDYSGGKGESAWPTRWSSIASLKERVLHMSLARSPGMISVDLKKFDLSPGAPQLELFPIAPELSGDVSKEFKPVSRRE